MSDRPTPDLSGRTVLVIDDHDDALYVLTTFLAHRRARVIGANSADEARDVLAHTTPDIILTDLHMPRESGVEFLSWLRTAAPPHLKHIPVVGISASSDYTSPDAARSFTAYFGKPTDYDEVCVTVDSLLRGTTV